MKAYNISSAVPPIIDLTGYEEVPLSSISAGFYTGSAFNSNPTANTVDVRLDNPSGIYLTECQVVSRFAGAAHGLQWLPYNGDLVSVAIQNDRAWLLGSYYAPGQVPVPTNDANKKHIIQTAQGLRILFDDEVPSITIADGKSNSVVLNFATKTIAVTAGSKISINAANSAQLKGELTHTKITGSSSLSYIGTTMKVVAGHNSFFTSTFSATSNFLFNLATTIEWNAINMTLKSGAFAYITPNVAIRAAAMDYVSGGTELLQKTVTTKFKAMMAEIAVLRQKMKSLLIYGAQGVNLKGLKAKIQDSTNVIYGVPTSHITLSPSGASVMSAGPVKVEATGKATVKGSGGTNLNM